MKETQENQAVTEIAPELTDKINALKAITTVHSLLGVGMFQHRHSEALSESIKFMEALHKQVMDEALLHPDSDKSAELVEFKQQKAMEEILKQAKGQE